MSSLLQSTCGRCSARARLAWRSPPALRGGWAPLSCESAFYQAQRRAGGPPSKGALLSLMLEALRQDGAEATSFSLENFGSAGVCENVGFEFAARHPRSAKMTRPFVHIRGRLLTASEDTVALMAQRLLAVPTMEKPDIVHRACAMLRQAHRDGELHQPLRDDFEDAIAMLLVLGVTTVQT